MKTIYASLASLAITAALVVPAEAANWSAMKLLGQNNFGLALQGNIGDGQNNSYIKTGPSQRWNKVIHGQLNVFGGENTAITKIKGEGKNNDVLVLQGNLGGGSNTSVNHVEGKDNNVFVAQGNLGGGDNFSGVYIEGQGNTAAVVQVGTGIWSAASVVGDDATVAIDVNSY